MNDTPYTRDELLKIGDQMPERGLLCHHCKEHIPRFAELSDADKHRIRHLCDENRPMMAMAELRAYTGCSLLWAKLWVHHAGKPLPSGNEAPCPYCGQPLRTSLARQCRFCLRDWHDQE